MAPAEKRSKKLPIGSMGQNELKTPNIKQLLRTLNSPHLDCLFFSNGPTMNASDFATMISRIVATPAAGVVNG